MCVYTYMYMYILLHSVEGCTSEVDESPSGPQYQPQHSSTRTLYQTPDTLLLGSYTILSCNTQRHVVHIQTEGLDGVSTSLECSPLIGCEITPVTPSNSPCGNIT